MGNIVITPKLLSGKISAIPSKSMAHRMLICAALADAPTRIHCPSLSKDITATADCLSALGAQIEYREESYFVTPIETPNRDALLDCGESGSTLRFLLPVVCALGVNARLKMHGRLSQRPLSPLWEELQAHGSILDKPETDVISVGGQLRPGEFTLAADVSSQFISGLLFALPLLKAESHITLVGNLESAGYVNMTRDVMAQFGVAAQPWQSGFAIDAGAAYRASGDLAVEGDWSNGAFWLVANALGSSIDVSGLDPRSAQGDRAVVDAIAAIQKGNAVIDAKDIPDLVPILSVLAAVSPGKTEFINAGRLRIKESDRLQSVCDMLIALKGDCIQTREGLIIQGKAKLAGGSVDSVNDHRIAMSAAVAATVCTDPVKVLGAEAVEKSYPAFWADYHRLGGEAK